MPPPPPLLPAPRDEVLDFCLISVAMALGLLANSDSLQKWEKEREAVWYKERVAWDEQRAGGAGALEEKRRETF